MTNTIIPLPEFLNSNSGWSSLPSWSWNTDDRLRFPSFQWSLWVNMCQRRLVMFRMLHLWQQICSLVAPTASRLLWQRRFSHIYMSNRVNHSAAAVPVFHVARCQKMTGPRQKRWGHLHVPPPPSKEGLKKPSCAQLQLHRTQSSHV